MRNSLTFLTGDAIYGLPQPHKWRRKVPDPATIITRKGVGEHFRYSTACVRSVRNARP